MVDFHVKFVDVELTDGTLIRSNEMLVGKTREDLEEKLAFIQLRRTMPKYHCLMLLMLPVVLTHILPGVIVFCWQIAILSLAISLFLYLLFCFFRIFFTVEQLDDMYSKPFKVLFALYIKLMLIIVTQTAFNYMYKFYENKYNYLPYPVEDLYDRLDPTCYFEHSYDEAVGVLSFLNWL